MFFPLRWFLLLVVAGGAQAQRTGDASNFSRPEMEEFLKNAAIGNERPLYPGATEVSRVTLSDGKRTHAAQLQTGDASFKLNVAAYELDKVLGLDLVPPSVERMVNNRPAAITWWVDDVAWTELDRRKKRLEPRDPDGWNRQMNAVRVFDELIANIDRNVGDVLITSEWRIWIIDHSRSFRARKQLKDPQTLSRCGRALLGRLRQLNREALQQKLGGYLLPEQLDALDARRELLVKHFDQEIAAKGESAVLYDSTPSR